ncbi:MFS general substrate transporter [Xylaria intraflava]|nr:MFS general substrate transporter [Xylaria intraflava]
MSQESIELGIIGAAADHQGLFQAESPNKGLKDAQDQDRNSSQNPEFSLPQADGGKDAWLFLAACFVVDALVWGYTFSFGVFHDYYQQHATFSSSGNLAIVGTSAVGILYLFSPVVLGVCRLYPHYMRFATPVGLLVACLSLSLASLATSTDTLIVLQGVLYAVGGAIAYCPTIPYIDEWFVARKGMAYGIVWSGEGLASTIIPLILERSLARFGHQATLLASGIIIFLICAPLSIFIKPRLPPSNTTAMRPWGFKFFMFSSLFVPYQLGNLVEGTGHFIPGIYLPTYARTVLGASGLLSALTVLLINISTTIGCVIMGILTDRLPATTCILISSAGATVSVFIIWGFSSSLAALYVFCVLYGLFAGSFTSTWPGIMRALGQNREADNSSNAIDPTMIYGWLCIGRGVGSLISGPLSDALTKSTAWKGHVGAGYGSGYGMLIVYTGVTALLSCSGFVWKKLVTFRGTLQH